MFNSCLNDELKRNLEEDEQLIWSDYPKQSFQIVFEDLIIIPFLLFLIFTVSFIFIKAINFNTNIELLITIVFFIIAIIFLIKYRYIQKVKKQKRVIYGLTSKRAIIVTDNKIQSLRLIDIKEITFIEHPFNYKYGSIIFGEPENIFDSTNSPPFEFKNLISGYHGGLNFKRDDFAFDFITDTKKVYNLIKSKINK